MRMMHVPPKAVKRMLDQEYARAYWEFEGVGGEMVDRGVDADEVPGDTMGIGRLKREVEKEVEEPPRKKLKIESTDDYEEICKLVHKKTKVVRLKFADCGRAGLPSDWYERSRRQEGGEDEGR